LRDEETLNTAQIEKWTGDFGRDYTDRNVLDVAGLDAMYRDKYGVTRTQLNDDFLKDIPHAARILEVGCNVGNQLLHLQHSGFKQLYGIEIQEYALQRAWIRLRSAELKQASAFEIPFPDGYFDLVFTSGVLIHIAPNDLPRALSEIYRRSRSYIWGFEYYAPEATEVNYRGSQDLLWKMDYAQAYLDRFSDLELVKEKRLKYTSDANVDTMFLLRKSADPKP
jgi:pseudaminic acid biosynthesis-associated methylase